MDSIRLLEASESFVNKSAEMAENDPHGFIITIVSISVVFASLIILYFAYTLIAKIVNSKIVLQVQAEPSPEEAAAPTLQQKDNDKSHDKESYVITIRKGQPQNIGNPTTIQQGSVSTSSLSNESSKTLNKVQNVVAPLPGVILAIKVNVGERVCIGQTIAILEAMKMENEIQTECDGTVKSINITNGESVLEGTVIITIE